MRLVANADLERERVVGVSGFVTPKPARPQHNGDTPDQTNLGAGL